MNRRILWIVTIILSIGAMLGYGREVLAFRSQPDVPGTAFVSPEVVDFIEVTETLKLLSPAGMALEDGRYGRSVLIDGNTLFVGQTQGEINDVPGRVYIYERHFGGQNNWGLAKIITASDSIGRDSFGNSLSIDGDTLLVGAVLADGNANESGAAYIFERNNGGPDNWGEVARLIALDGAYEDRFAWTADIAGDTAVVGARWDDNSNGSNAGAVYVFERNAGGPNNWGQVRKVLASDGSTSDRLGLAVAIAGDTIVAGADGQSDNGSESGSAYILERNAGGSNNWGEVAQLYSDQPAANDLFGIYVDIEGDLVAVGGQQTSPDPGAVYLFDRNAGGANNWGQVDQLVPSDGAAGDRFGVSFSLVEGKLIIGARHGDGAEVNSGAAYLFEPDNTSPGQWMETGKLVASDGETNDWFGWNASMSGEVIVVGAYFNDDFCPSDPNCDSGSAYLYTAVLPSDVAIVKTVSTGTAVPGQPLSYTIAFTNAGPDIAFGTVITDLIPASIVNLTFTSSGVTITPTGNVPFVWQVADLAPGTGGVITVTGVVSPELVSETTIVNAAVISNSQDISPTNNSSTAVTQVIIPQVNLSAADYVINEGRGAVTVTAVLSPAQPFLDVSVAYETADGSAIAGEDYTAVSGILTFTAGMTETQILVPILDDQLVEPVETFALELSNPIHATLGDVVTATITILDDDTYPELNLSAADYSVLEDAGQVALTVTLTHPYPEAVSVVYETANGTAVAGADFTAVSAILTFTAGTTGAQILVLILDDQLVELEEAFTLELSDLVHAVPGNIVSATITIVDDDIYPELNLNASQYAVLEDAGQAIVTATLSVAYPETVTVSYETVDGTAGAGEDYTAVNDILTFTPGMTITTLTVPILDDTLVEGDETFLVSLSNFSNATPGLFITTTVTILDNDEEPPPPVINYLYLPIIMRPAPTPPPTAFPIWISSGVAPQPVISQGEIFYTATITMPADLPPTGQFFFSADSDDLLEISVDDELAFVLNGQELFVKRFSLDGQTIYAEIVPMPRQTLALMAGQTIIVVFRDVFGDHMSATPIWLIHVP